MNAPIHDDISALAALRGPLMGLDLGTKTIGIAVSDGLRISATAVETLRRSKFAIDAARLEKIIAERGICLLYTSPSPRDRQRSRMPSSA